MTQTCSACGAVDLPTASCFCLSCGVALPPKGHTSIPYTPEHLLREILTSKTAREGERKEVTVLFADVADSLAMAEALDPEDIHSIMDGFFQLSLDVIHAEGGTINQFRGDGFMALFGAPLAKGEDAARALRAALAIRDRTTIYSREVEADSGIPLYLRIGLNTGIVWVGSIGDTVRTDYTAEGPTVGLAARLEQAALPGQILASDETVQCARPLFEFRELEVRAFHGISRPVRVHELVGAGLYRDRFDAERAHGPTGFVGREPELAWLDEITASAARGSLRIAEVRGEPGIGKSRLVLEHSSRRRAAARILEARCSETDATRAYAPWLRILRGWRADVPGAEAAHELAREFGSMASEGAGSRETFTRKLVEVLAAAAADRTLLVVLEDVHWLDRSSREVLDGITKLEPSCACLILTTARSEQPGWSDDAPVDRLELGPFQGAESDTLARDVLAGLEHLDDLVALVVDRAGGNPLFIEEVARALREGPEDLRRTARLEVELLQSRTRIPTTLRGIIAARIDALPDPAKRLLQALSVLDLPFDSTLAAALEPEAGQDVEELLRELVQRALLARGPDSTLGFRHGLVRETAYSQLVRSRRRALHGRCAEALIGRDLADTPNGASRIGFHYDQAGDARDAAEFLSAAGKAYLALYSPTEAVAHLCRAWEIHRKIGSDAATRVSVGLSLTSAFNALDRASEAAEVLAVLEGDDLETVDRKRLGRACIESGWVRFSETNDAATGRDLVERGLGLLSQISGGARTRMVGHAYLSRIDNVDGEVERSAAHAERVYELATASGDRFFQVIGLSYRGTALCDGGRVEEALEDCLRAASIADQMGSEVASAFAHNALAEAYLFHGDPAKALSSAERARDTAERLEQVGIGYQASSVAGHTYLLLGDPARALREFDRMATINPKWASVLDHRARCLLECGRRSEAIEAAHQCLARNPPKLVQARVLCTYGLALGTGEREDLESAQRALFDSISLCERLGLRPHLAAGKLAVAEVAQYWEDGDRARRYLSQAVALYESCGMPLHAQGARERFPDLDGDPA